MNKELIESLNVLEKEKEISKEVLFEAIENSLVVAYKNNFNKADNVIVNVDRETGDFHIYSQKEVVEEVFDPVIEISLEDARAIKGTYEIGDMVNVEIQSKDFGRIATQSAKNGILQKIREEERKSVFEQYYEKQNDIITGIVQRINGKNISVNLGKTDTVLMEKEQVPGEHFRPTDRIKLYITEVKDGNKGPRIVVSRTHPGLVKRLFEQEVPEINDGLITIKKIARIPGERAKIAVESYDERIDPVGACVGVKGSRIHGIVRELRNENIDVINYTSNIQLFIQRALSPAKVSSIIMHEDEKRAEVYLKPEEVSLAIGKGGLNIKLASMLTEYTIDVYRELGEDAVADEDIYLDEFKDEIDEWVINAIKAIGIDTAKGVLNAPREMLIEKADLEENTVDDILRILKAEFEE